MHQGRRPAQYLFDCIVDARLEVFEQPGFLFGMVLQIHDRVGHGVTRGVIGGADQQGEERAEFFLAHALTFMVGLHHPGHEVVIGLATAALGLGISNGHDSLRRILEHRQR